MDNEERSAGKLIRDTTKAGGSRIGHGLDGLRNRAGRQVDATASRGGHIEPGQAAPVETGSGNTSETGVGTPETGGPDLTNPTAPRSPLGPGMGCSRPAGTMFIASVWLALTALRHKRG